MRYTPRSVFKEFHASNWHRAILLCHRRAGKTVATCAEMLRRAYNGPADGQYLFISPLAEQSMANTIGIFATLDNSEGYIIKFDKTNGVLSLANGAQITLGGARTAEKFRGRYLNGCFDGNTEVLTDWGWMKFRDAVDNPETRYAQFDQNTGKISFDYPLKRFEFEDREVMKLNLGDKVGDFICTPNHKWLTQDKRTTLWRRTDAIELNAHRAIPRAALNVDINQRLTPFQRLTIAIQADGCVVDRALNTFTYRIAFNKERKIARFIKILKDCNLEVVPHKTPDGLTAFYFTLPKQYNITKDLTTVFDLETVPAYDFMQEVKCWDGSTFGNDGIYYSSISKKNRDFVQAVAVLAGYRTVTSTQVDDRKDNHSDIYRLFCSTNNFPGSTKVSKEKISQRQTVYCVQMPHGTLVVRNERAAVITGNCAVDELSQVSPEIIAEVILPCLSDRNGWLCFLGTARVDDNYRLYNMYKQYAEDPNWFSAMISVYDNPEAFPPERIEEIKKEHIQYCLAAGMSMTQALQSFNVEFECDFSFIDEGRPNMSAMFYNELTNLFNAKPARIIDAHDEAAMKALTSTQRVAVFDISHSTGRDYTVATFLSLTDTTPYVTGVEWENNQPLQFWFDRLRMLGIKTVALPFDSAAVNKETMLSLNQTFRREGFNVIKIKRLLRPEQENSGRWLLNNATFFRECIPALSEVGKFNEWRTKHGLEQDVVASLLYAGQVAQKKHVKLFVAETIRTRYNNNASVYDTGVSFYSGDITGE